MNNRASIIKNLHKVFPSADTIDVDSKGWPYEVQATIVGAELTQTSSQFLTLTDQLENIFGAEVYMFHEHKALPAREDSMGRIEPGSPSEIVIVAKKRES